MKFGLLPDIKTKYCYKKTIIEGDIPNEFNIMDFIDNVQINHQIYNDCSANALQKQIQIAGKLKNKEYIISILYQYYNSRIIGNNFSSIPKDEGSRLEDVYEAIKTYHFIDNDRWDYYKHEVNECPDVGCYREAIKNRGVIMEFEKIQPINEVLKFYISKYRPIVCGIPIFSNFENLNEKNYILYDPSDERISPTRRSNLLGFHAVLLVGYNKDGFIVLNSHGNCFANHGYFILSYDYTIMDPYIINLS
jgi:hypothetical protein